MSSVKTHYESLLGPIYLWMAGGIENALEQGAAEVTDLLHRPGLAVDLGAGFGMHAIPLARAGYQVLAIDSSAYLLEQLRSFSEGLPVKTVVADLMRFGEHLPPDRKADVILCMGDTLTHLPDQPAVGQLIDLVAATLSPQGRFVATFRDYTTLPTGDARFIPVRSDATRIHTCFLEEAPDHVLVHDILHEKHDAHWSTRVSSYKKLRLSPVKVCRQLEASGLKVFASAGPRGMVKVVADV
jgi:SAM-dependent methyltransferase